MSSLGAAPFFVLGRLSAAWEGLANAAACGVMLAASFDLIHEVRRGREEGARAHLAFCVARELCLRVSPD